MSTVTDQTTALDRAAALQQGTRRFSAFYERHAYLVYNLSLRITCDRAVAIESARAAFLASVAAPEPDEGLVKTAVSQALAVAPDRPADPKGAGDAEAEALLRATAALSPAERATLALTDIAGASTIKIGAIMDVSKDAAGALLVRAFAGLSELLGMGHEETQAAYRAWLLVEPPQELWEGLYADFYRGLHRSLREDSGAANGNGAAPIVAERESRRARRRAQRAAKREGPRRWRMRWAASLLVLVIAGGAGAWKAGLVKIGHHSGGASHDPSLPSAFRGRLTPSELDKLRLRELRQQRAVPPPPPPVVQKPKTKPKGPTPAQKRAAARRKLARRRLARLRHQNQPKPPKQPPATPPPPSKPPKTPQSTGPGSSSQGQKGHHGSQQTPSPSTCVLDQNTGQYICPQQ